MTTFLIISGVLNILSIPFIIYAFSKLKKISEKEEYVKNGEKEISDKMEQLQKSYQEKENLLESSKKTLEKTYQTKLNQISDIVNGNYRQGYYTGKFSQSYKNGGETKVVVDIYVKEIDRYTNGKSKIELLEIDYTSINGYTNLFNKEENENYIRETFQKLKDTDSIEWLESVNEIQKERENKLKRILGNQNQF